MKVRLEVFDSELDVPYLWRARDGRAYYRRPAVKGKGTKVASRAKQVLLPVSAPESLALLCSLLTDLDDLGFLDVDAADRLVKNLVSRLPEDIWTRIDQTPLPEFANDLVPYFHPSQFELALLRMTAGPYIVPSMDDYLNMQRVMLHTLEARHIEAVLQLGEHNEEAQALYDQFLEETGEDDERPDSE